VGDEIDASAIKEAFLAASSLAACSLAVCTLIFNCWCCCFKRESFLLSLDTLIRHSAHIHSKLNKRQKTHPETKVDLYAFVAATKVIITLLSITPTSVPENV
jgi:hypothetical protein